MKLFDRRIDFEFLANGPLYSLLAMYMPMSALTAFVSVLDILLPISLPLILLMTCSYICALAASLYCDFLKDSKSDHTTANIRGGIIIFIVLYIASSLFRLDVDWKEKFLPNLTNVPVCACAIYMWVNVISLKSLFTACKRLQEHTEQYSGEKLKTVIFEDSSLLQYTDERILKARQNYLVKIIILGILAIACSFTATLPLLLYLLLATILVCGICIFGLFGILREEHYYAGEGVCLSISDRTKRILAIIVFSLICVAAAILPSSNKSILPFSIITDFFKWLFSLFKPRSVDAPPLDFENTVPMDSYESIPNFDEMAPPSSPFWDQFMKYFWMVVRYGAIILVAVGFIRFMISPLLNRGDVSDKLTFRQRLKKIITEWYRSMVNAFAAFLAYLRSDKSASKLRKYGNEEIRRAAESIFGAYSPAKRNDIRRSVNLFARLIIWGDEMRGVTWKPSLAPGEYCHLLASAKNPQKSADDNPALQTALRRLNAGIVRCGELFEQALYSAEVLSEKERSEFKYLVEKITAVSE